MLNGWPYEQTKYERTKLFNRRQSILKNMTKQKNSNTSTLARLSHVSPASPVSSEGQRVSLIVTHSLARTHPITAFILINLTRYFSTLPDHNKNFVTEEKKKKSIKNINKLSRFEITVNYF